MRIGELFKVVSSGEVNIRVVDSEGKEYESSLSVKEIEKFGDQENWLLTLEVEKYYDDGSKIVVGKSPYNSDLTTYLLQYKDRQYNLDRWPYNDERDVDNTFTDRLGNVNLLFLRPEKTVLRG